MSEYSLILSNTIQQSGQIKVFELCKNGNSIFEEFISSIQTNIPLLKDLASAIKTIEQSTTLGQRIAKGKFRELKGLNLNCKVYEAKKGDVRLYLFHKENTGRVVVTGGIKKKQDKDINQVTNIIKEYYKEH